MEVPIRDGKIKMADAIKCIAEVVYPDKVKSHRATRREAEKAVRERIREAFKKGVFGRMPYSNVAELDATEFFTWARARKKWQVLIQIDLPHRTLSGDMSAQEADDTTTDFEIKIPPKEILEQCYIEAIRKLTRCEKYIADIKPDLAELAELRRKKKETSVQRAEHGSKGGRAKTK